MKRNLSLAIALGTTLCIAPACSKEKKPETKTEGKSTDTASEAARPTETKTAPKGSTASASQMLAYMPASTEIVISFSMQSLTTSPLWKQFGPMALAAASSELGQIEEACGFNPIAKLKSVYLGVDTTNEKQPVLVVQGFERAELTKCISSMAEKEGKKVTVEEEGAFTFVHADAKDENINIAWAGNDTLIMVPEQDDKAYLQARLDGKDSLSANAAFTKAAGKANQAAPIWFAAAFKEGSPAAQGLGQMGSAPSGVFGSIGFTSGLELAVGVSFADEAAAKSTIEMIKPFIGMAKGQLGPNGALLDKLQLVAQGADMMMSMNLSEADLATLQALAGPMMGGLGQ